jgi:hypothetical protein
VLSGCNDLTEITINNCNSLTNLVLPTNVKKLTITNCSFLNELRVTYSSINGSISNLELINVDNCPGLKIIDISGQNNQTLKVNLIGAWNLEELNLSGLTTTDILLPSLYIDGSPYFNSLKSLDISNTHISNFIYNDNPKDSNGNFIANSYLDLSNFPNLDSIKAYNNSSLTEIRCKNDQNNPINLETQSFINCTSLRRIKGNFNIVGMEVFKNCGSFKLNEESTYDNVLPDQFIEGEDATNISINYSTLRSVFENCGSLTYNDFKRIIAKLNNGVISIEALFKGCYGISGEI